MILSFLFLFLSVILSSHALPSLFPSCSPSVRLYLHHTDDPHHTTNKNEILLLIFGEEKKKILRTHHFHC